MKRKFISAMLFGALLIAPATTFVGCADYDDDIENLQDQITNNATTLDQLTKEKIQNVETEIESLKAANKQLQEALDKAKSEGTDADAATLAAAQKLVEDAQAQLQAALDAVNGDITGINGKITDINGQIIDLDAKYTTANGQIIDLNGKISDLDARLLAQDGRLKSVESLLAADGKLTLAINDAQALAEKAYNLATLSAHAWLSGRIDFRALVSILLLISTPSVALSIISCAIFTSVWPRPSYIWELLPLRDPIAISLYPILSISRPRSYISERLIVPSWFVEYFLDTSSNTDWT